MTTLFRAVLVDDEPSARRLLTEFLRKYPLEIDIIGEADTGKAAVLLINDLKPDLVFMDIQMPGMSGLEVLKAISNNPYIIFTTAHDSYAVEAFESFAIDYLLKPIQEKALQRSLAKLQRIGNIKSDPDPMQRALEMLSGRLQPVQVNKTLSVKKGNKIVLLQLADIAYLQANDKYTYVHTTDGRELFSDHMLATLEARLNDDFVRVQKSYIVNKTRIAEIYKYSNNRFTIVLSDKAGTKLVSGPSYCAVIREAFQL